MKMKMEMKMKLKTKIGMRTVGGALWEGARSSHYVLLLVLCQVMAFDPRYLTLCTGRSCHLHPAMPSSGFGNYRIAWGHKGFTSRSSTPTELLPAGYQTD